MMTFLGQEIHFKMQISIAFSEGSFIEKWNTKQFYSFWIRTLPIL